MSTSKSFTPNKGEKMKRSIAVTISLLFLFGVYALAQAPTKLNLTDKKVFITQMEGGLHSFLAAEIIKKKLPIKIVTTDEDADYVIVGASLKGDDKWHHTIFGGKDKNEGSIQLIDAKEKAIVWAGEAGDRSLMWGGWKRGGQRKVADRLINKMKDDLFKK
jgi:hypothetical protein